MRSSNRILLSCLVASVSLLWTSHVGAQQQVQGFAVDRLYQSAPGAGWVVMDTLDTHGGLGGVAALSTWYAHDPLRLRTTDGVQRLTVVSDQAMLGFAFAATYQRWKLYLNLDMPLAIGGNEGTVGGYQLAAPASGQQSTPSGVNPSTTTDAFADARVGLDVRIVGRPGDPFRLGAGGQLLIATPNTVTGEYLTDGALRAMGRLLVAGDIGMFAYAGQLGVHIRPRDDSPSPGGPQGSELLFGIAAGPRWRLGDRARWAFLAGPEIFGQTAFRSFFGTGSFGVESLVSARLEETGQDGAQLRFKVAGGPGLEQRFGTPEWRVFLGVEIFNRSVDSDGDGVTDSKDACPNLAGEKTQDPKTNGCPPADPSAGRPAEQPR